jgi:MerR family mercuric resistance operon transcriptional regulator
MIGELSNLTGVGVEAIRYYERIGLLPPPRRTAGGRRSYDNTSRQTLSFIKRSRQLGFSLEDIRALLTLRASKPCCVDVKTIAERHLDLVRSKLQLLREMEAILSETIALCPGDESTDCPVLNILGSQGSEAAPPSA